MASSLQPSRWRTAMFPVGSRSEDKASQFDTLPSEIIEKILDYLGPRDLTMFASSFSRIEAILTANSKLLQRIKMDMPIIRAVKTGQRHVTKTLRRCTSSFVFLPSDEDRKLSYLLHLANSIPTGCPLLANKHLVVVLAASYIQAHSFYIALMVKNFKVYSYNDYISREAWEQLRQETKKFFLVVTKIHENFELSSMAAIINFRPVYDANDYYEVHSLDPRRVFQVLDTSPEVFTVWKSIFHRLNPLSSSRPSFASNTPLEIDRNFFKSRAQMRGSEVSPVFE